jgi:hypothetical protein
LADRTVERRLARAFQRAPVTMMSPPTSPGWPVGSGASVSPCCGSVASIDDGAASTAEGAVPWTGVVGAGGTACAEAAVGSASAASAIRLVVAK